MNYLVLARKWRPQSFKDVVGQESTVRTLCNALKSGRLAHAFLFAGSRGTGKTSLARILAKAMSCEQGITENPCGQCVHCTEITAGHSIDVIEIDGASNTGVDDVRELRETTRYQPASARFKIFIIDEVHMLSTNAFNALLKTLEEPPPHVKFIFATTEPHKIPITIQSRCQRYDLRRISTDLIVNTLDKVLKEEKTVIEMPALRLIAQAAQGGMRDALSLTDQVLSFGSEHLTINEVSEILGIKDRRSVLSLCNALLEKNAKAALACLDEALSVGTDLKRYLDLLAQEFRHLSIAAALGSVEGLVDLTNEEIADINKRAALYDPQDLQRIFGMLLEGIDQTARSDQPILAMELLLLKIATRPDLGEVVAITQAIARLEALVKKKPLELAPKIAQPPVKSETPPPSLNGIDDRWLQFVSAVSALSKAQSVHFEFAKHALHVRNNQTHITITFEQPLHFDQCKTLEQDPRLHELVKRHYGPTATLHMELAEPIKAAIERESVPDSTTIYEAKATAQKEHLAQISQSAQDNPIIKKALALFGGELKAVRPSAKGQDV